MVLQELGQQIGSALTRMREASAVDDETLKALLDEIGAALQASDVNLRQVIELKVNISREVKKIKVSEVASSVTDEKRLVQDAVVRNVTRLLGTDRAPWKPQRGQSNVIMFVGLQGAGKTTTVTKMAYYYQRRGWKAALVCADTFRAGAFDQLKQNATKARIPFFGSNDETDPVAVAADGVAQFRDDGYEIIIVDTSGRHHQEAALFEEMLQISEVVAPDNTVFVLDSTIGQAARDQAEAFSSAVDVGSVIVTKLDGHAKGGGALSAVAAANAPIVFIGTGEHIDQFEEFETESFVRRILGFGDLARFAKTLQDAGMENQERFIEGVMKNELTLRHMRDQFANVLKLGPINNVMSMIPGMSQILNEKSGEDSQQRIRMFLTIMDSMTDAELDSGSLKVFQERSRIERIARGAGVYPPHVFQLLESFKPFQKMGGVMQKMQKNRRGPGGKVGAEIDANEMAKMFDPKMLAQVGGAGGLKNMMRQVQGMDPGALKNLMQSMGVNGPMKNFMR